MENVDVFVGCIFVPLVLFLAILEGMVLKYLPSPVLHPPQIPYGLRGVGSFCPNVKYTCTTVKRHSTGDFLRASATIANGIVLVSISCAKKK